MHKIKMCCSLFTVYLRRTQKKTNKSLREEETSTGSIKQRKGMSFFLTQQIDITNIGTTASLFA